MTSSASIHGRCAHMSAGDRQVEFRPVGEVSGPQQADGRVGIPMTMYRGCPDAYEHSAFDITEEPYHVTFNSETQRGVEDGMNDTAP